MKTSDRVTYIREVAQKLAQYEWADIDLILGQFHMPTSNLWGGGSKNEYIIHHIKDSLDYALKELRDYVAGDTPINNGQDIANSIEEKIWLPDKFRLFFSHLSSDKLLVADVKQKLVAYGIDCFVAHEDIDPTLEWQDMIESALQSCDAMAVFLTQDFHNSNWTDQEIGFCVARRILIIPLKIDINPYGFIGKYQAQNCSSLSPSQIAEKIFDILINSSLTSAKFSEAIVANFVVSPTWESARARSLLLSKIKIWTPELLRSIENSLETNNHIPDAYGVPDRIRAILTKHKQ